jgi:hypothetical protein
VWSTRIDANVLSFELTGGLAAPLSDDQSKMQAQMTGTPTMHYALGFEDEPVAINVGANVSYRIGRTTVYAGYKGRTDSNRGSTVNAGLRVAF